ncbi:hypothetical protein CAEBREN_06949 [Caenorhabditis brenneri]|uniref:MATH domain-containing protein n=1 Tax=Caenorhabditis brenneri TaxID=135651 RepID=G0MD87_CAEBE|nr:hypothetical protein CAEBREN_06949 [Caenorhabditis brenneri]
MSVPPKTVTLTATFKNISSMKLEDQRYGEEEDHYGLYWSVKTSFFLKLIEYNLFRRAWAVRPSNICGPKGPNLLFFGFGCQEFDNKKNWTVDVDYEFRLTPKNGEKIVQTGNIAFKKIDTDYVILNFVRWEEREKYMIDDTIKIEYFITIKEVTGFPNFESKEEFTDVFVHVNGERNFKKIICIST